MHKFRSVLAGIAIIAALLACNLPSNQQDPAAVMTSAALTVQAALSPTIPAGAPTATFTSAAFPTPPASATPAPTLPPVSTPTSSCDHADFITDVTYPDNSDVDGGDNFTKTWRFRNAGTCSWTPSYSLVFVSGESMSGPSVQALTGNVNPGKTVDISVALTAPSSNGTHTGNWGLRNAAGVIFARFFVQIKVGGGPFAVIHVTYAFSTWSDSSHTDCPRVTAQITTNNAGSVTYHWTRSDSTSSSNATINFDSAGTISVKYDWALGSASSGTTNWLGIYIDDPNHQDFNHKTFTTACTSP